MKFRKVVKKCMIYVMTGAILLAAANPLGVRAAGTIDKVSVSKPTYGVVNISSGTLNVRQSASTSSDIVSSLQNGAYIMIVGQSGDFYRVQYNKDGSYGYVSKDYITYWGNYYSTYLKVDNLSTNLNLRKMDNTSSEVLASLAPNTAFAHAGTMTDWYFGVWGNLKGYAYADYVIECTF